jgi:hypothetical protein
MKVKIVELIVPLLLVATANVAKAQQAPATPAVQAKESEAQKSNIEKFIAARGVLLVKKYGTIGEIDGKFLDKVKIKTLIISTPATSGTLPTYGVRFERPPVGKFESSEVGFIDFDESKGVVEAIKYMISLSETMKTENHENTEIHFNSRGEISVGFFQARGEQTAIFKVDGKSVFLEMKQLVVLQNLIESAISSLVKEGAK